MITDLCFLFGFVRMRSDDNVWVVDLNVERNQGKVVIFKVGFKFNGDLDVCCLTFVF